MASQFFAPVTGGEERLVGDLSQALVARGHEVHVVTTTDVVPDEAPGAPRLHRIGSLTHRVAGLHTDAERRHLPPSPDPEAAARLKRLIQRMNPDIIHAHNWLVYSLLPRAVRGSTPLVLSLHDYGLVCANKRLMRDHQPCSGPGLARCIRCASDYYGPAKGAPTALLLRASSRALAGAVDIFLPVSPAVAAGSGLAAAGLPHLVVPDFIPDALLERRGAVERPDGVPEGGYIAFAGDLTHDKGITTLVAAYEKLHDPPPLVLAGRRLSAEAVELRPGMVALGPRPHHEVMEIFRGALAVVVPSVWNEPFGLVALEAMAMGRPVVASSVGGLADILREGGGLLVPPGDAAALATALRRLIASPDLRRQVGAAARRRAEAYRASAIVPHIESVYESLLRPRGVWPPPRVTVSGRGS